MNTLEMLSLCVTTCFVPSTVISRSIGVQNVTYLTSDNDISVDQTLVESQQRQQQTDQRLYSSALLNVLSTNAIRKNRSAGYLTRVGTLIVATIYLQLIQNRYMFRSFTVLKCSHQHCLQPVASDVEVVGYL